MSCDTNDRYIKETQKISKWVLELVSTLINFDGYLVNSQQSTVFVYRANEHSDIGILIVWTGGQRTKYKYNITQASQDFHVLKCISIVIKSNI